VRQSPLVVVLHGAVPDDAPPDEQDVVEEVRVVGAALAALGYRAEPVALTLDLETARARLEGLAPAIVFNLVESVGGSGRLVALGPLLLDELGLRYTGVSAEAMLLTSNKRLAKRLLSRAGILTPEPGEAVSLPAGAGPWIVKSVWEHASIGLDDEAVVADAAAAVRRLEKVRRERGGDWLVERYVAGREINLALLDGPGGPQILPAAEIVFDDYPPGRPRIVGYQAKWAPESVEYRSTRRRFLGAEDRELVSRLGEIALACWSLFGLRGYARVDFRVDAEGRPWVLEVNANPCLSPDAGFMAGAERVGLDLRQVVERLLAAALKLFEGSSQPQVRVG